ncbi:tetratricopeptide repeat protein [Deinococcus sp. KSM4-11]|uniref:tetratricopeptide repeat protein n=1 Tax=Deinococcus sp. KSM4-11 TaxID=2568654 RepID=UPI0010A3F092|nr:tetratricopeptide repeat protein [Deinococcus sp. KSM4-11]THF86743.1 tetratricopeptide repeat protein [Deinococcus sp. KSM4-11]
MPHRMPVLAALLALLPAAAHAQPARPTLMYAFSDARERPAPAALRGDLQTARSWTCRPSSPVAALQTSLKAIEAQLAGMDPKDPNRAVFQKMLDDLRASATTPPASTVPAPALTFAAALKNAHSWLQQHEAAGLRAFEASPDSKNPARATLAALSASTLGKPGAALAALLAAERLKPGDPQVRVNLGGVLSSLELPAEALAVLSAVKPGAGTGALGLSNEAVWQNNRGFALLQLGRAAEAERAFQKAVQLAPGLAEASLNLARAEMCLGKTPAAVQHFGAGLRRTPSPAAQATSPRAAALAQEITTRTSGSPADSPTRRPLHVTYDLSHGRSTTLPNLKIPWTPAEMVALEGQYRALRDELGTRMEALNKRGAEVERLLRARGEPSPLAASYRSALWSAILTSDREPRLAALRRTMEKSGRAPDEIWTAFWHCEGNCKIDVFTTQASKSQNYKETLRTLCIPALEADHNRFRGAMLNWATDIGAYLKASYRLDTALAANYRDPLWHERASLSAEWQATALFWGYVSQASAWALDIKQFQDSCVKGDSDIQPSKEPVATPLELPRSSICKDLLGGWSTSLTVGVGSVTINCDSVSVTAATPGWIGAFSTLSHSFGSDEYTVFVGIQETLTVPVPITPVGISSQQGVYVTWGDKGVVDAGAQITTSVSAGGALEEIGLSRDLITPVTGAVSGQWSFVSSGGATP